MPKSFFYRISAAALITVAPAAAHSQATAGSVRGPADLIVLNGRIYTVDENHPMVSAFAVRNGRFLFAGSEREVRALAGPKTRIVDVHGATVIPGMVDAHEHLLGVGVSLTNVNLAGSKTYDEVIQRTIAHSKDVKPGEWIIGRGWDQNLWPDKQFPTHDALTKAFPDNPVVLGRIDGHALLANAMAMRVAKITAATPDPSGGRVLRFKDNSPTGVFVDNAESLIDRVEPPPTREQNTKALLAAVAYANSWGLTGIHDPGEPQSVIDVYESLAKAGNLNLRAYILVSGDSRHSGGEPDYMHYMAIGPRSDLYNGRVWVRSIKLYADGALGSRGAALLAPYSDDPGNTGLLVTPPTEIERIAELGLRKGFQIATHAIGDRGNRLTLDAYEQALKAVPTADHRFRIEHAQVISPADIPRFAQLGVIPSMQGSHQTSDMRWAETRLGPERIKGAYAWRSLLNTGVIIPNGSDAPVEEVNPLISFHSSVSRQDATNWPQGGWYADQVMTREEALESMTIWPAYAAFQEKIMGSITPGKYADFVVLDRDIMTVPATDILATKVKSTWLGGKSVYEAGASNR